MSEIAEDLTIEIIRKRISEHGEDLTIILNHDGLYIVTFQHGGQTINLWCDDLYEVNETVGDVISKNDVFMFQFSRVAWSKV